MRLSSPAFEEGKLIPTRFTCEGEDMSPELSWEDAPGNVKSFALVLHDPDAPREGGFTHWVMYNIPQNVHRLEENIAKQATVAGIGVQARNDGGKIGYVGPCPPSGIHRYFFRLIALDTMLDLKPGAPHQEVLSALHGHRLGEAELMGTYQKKADRAA